jgi:hypothetical protein
MTVALSKTDIESFNNDGVVVLRGVFKEWIDILIRGAEFHINNPSSSALVHQKKNIKGILWKIFVIGSAFLSIKILYLIHPWLLFLRD